MGKLSDLWQEYKSLPRDHPKRKELQSDINKIEEWMIEKGYKTDGVTQWYDTDAPSTNYPWKSGAVWFEDMWQCADLNGVGINYNYDKSVRVI